MSESVRNGKGSARRQEDTKAVEKGYERVDWAKGLGDFWGDLEVPKVRRIYRGSRPKSDANAADEK